MIYIFSFLIFFLFFIIFNNIFLIICENPLSIFKQWIWGMHLAQHFSLGWKKNWQVNLCLHFMLLLKLSVRSLGEICGPQAKFSFMTDLRLSSEVLWKADLSKNWAFINQWRILKWPVNEGEAWRVQCASSPVLGTKGSCQLCSLEPYISEIKGTLNTPV